eukprot:COSAG02_NODE_37245_length_444_cov_0.901449_1_plen_87_part_00
MGSVLEKHKKECERVYLNQRKEVADGLSIRIASALPETEVSEEVRSTQQALVVADLQGRIEFKNAEKAAKVAEEQRKKEENAANQH